VTCLEDVLEEFAAVGDILRESPVPAANAEGAGVAVVGLTPQEREVWQAVVEGAEDADTLCSRVSISTGGVMSALTGLELKGLVRRMPGGRYERRHGATKTEDTLS
jgi:predicted Rossmann fold nucleotide-binding protein DprA/Smf involved in DNA uptake